MVTVIKNMFMYVKVRGRKSCVLSRITKVGERGLVIRSVTIPRSWFNIGRGEDLEVDGGHQRISKGCKVHVQVCFGWGKSCIC